MVLSKIVTTLLSILYGILVSFYLMISIIINRNNFFRKKRRDVAPDCLNDPSLGTHHFIQLKDIKLHYVSAGDVNKQVMLFIHGFPEFWYSWRHQMKEFSNDYYVLSIDQRGYGETDKPNGIHNYTIDKLVEDIRQLLEALDKNHIILVAHDWGGAVAWNFAAKYPELLEKLIILNSPHPLKFMEMRSKSWKQFMYSWYMLFFSLPLLPEFALQSNDYYVLDFSFKNGEGMPFLTPEQMDAYKYTFHKNSFTCPLNYYRAVILQYPSKPTKSYQIKVPTVIIWGKKDNWLTSELAEVHNYVDDLTVHYIDNCSHWAQMDQPLLVNQYMRQFLSQRK